MIFGFGKSRKKDVPAPTDNALRPAFVCSHILQGMKEGNLVGFFFSRDEEGDLSAVCEICETAADAQPDFKIVSEEQAASYALSNGVAI